MRVGVIGTGFGARVVAPAFAAAGCTVDVASARDDAAVAALCAGDADLVCVHSPPFMHLRHVEMAVAGGVGGRRAGRAVLCDKPFGRSASEAEAMVRLASEAGALNFVNFEFRHEPARVMVKELLDDRVVGAVEHVSWTALNSGSRVPLRRWGWLFDRSAGGGWIGAWGSHAIDAVRWWLGEVVSAGAACSVTVPSRPDASGALRTCDAEDGFTAWMVVDTGATVGIDTSFVAPVTMPTRVVIIGSDGAIEVVNDHRITIRRSDGGREERELPAVTDGDVHDVAMRRWAAFVAAAVSEGRQAGPSFADGAACATVMDALRGT